jgi:hypothetical protein
VLLSGQNAWYALVEGDDPERVCLAISRIEQWEARMVQSKK